MDPMTIALLGSLIAGGIGASTKKGGLFGKPEKKGSTYSPGAQGLLDNIISQVKGLQGSAGNIQKDPNYLQGQEWLQSLFNDPDFFQQFEAPLQRQFEEQTIPDLANRFASMGSGGSLGSTGFRNQLAREGSNLGTNIAALRGGMQQQAIPQLAQYAQQPFSNYQSLLGTATTPTQNTYQPASTGFFGGILPGLVGGAAQGYGQMWGQNMAGRTPGQYPGTY